MSSDDQVTEEPPYVKPTAREQPSGPRAETVQSQNRRAEYLRRHPSYFDDLNHELKAPVLYQRLIKTFQTVQERELDGKNKGYGRTLEASLLRGEEKFASVDPARAHGDPSINPSDNSWVDESWDQEPRDKEEGIELWRQFLTNYFIKGKDEEFAYGKVDSEEDLDTLKQEDAAERWFDDEEPGWVSGERGARGGETGVQDF